MNQWIRDLLEQFGVVGVAGLMLLENLIPPIPSEVVMPWAGYAVSQGQMSLWSVVLGGSLGSFAGAVLWYAAAARIGKQRLLRWVEKHGAWLTLTTQDVERTDAWFDKRGAAAVLICRLIPGLRTLISIPAGFARMSLGSFLTYTAIGTSVWTALLAIGGWWLGENYSRLAAPLSWISTGVIATLGLIWGLRLARQYGRRRASR